jgi:hypothetical protein
MGWRIESLWLLKHSRFRRCCGCITDRREDETLLELFGV